MHSALRCARARQQQPPAVTLSADLAHGAGVAPRAGRDCTMRKTRQHHRAAPRGTRDLVRVMLHDVTRSPCDCTCNAMRANAGADWRDARDYSARSASVYFGKWTPLPCFCLLPSAFDCSTLLLTLALHRRSCLTCFAVSWPHPVTAVPTDLATLTSHCNRLCSRLSSL